MANAVPTMVVRIDLGDDSVSMPRLQLRDRRAAGNRQLFWVFQRQLEQLLYHRGGDGGSSGAIWKILNQTGLGSTAFQVSAAALSLGQVTDQELGEVLAQYKRTTDGIDVSSHGRIRSCTLLPLATAATVCRTFGRSDASMGFLRAFAQPVPQAWELEAQAEQDAAVGEVDLVLMEQLEAEQGLEAEQMSFAQELTEMAKFSAHEGDEGRMTQYALRNVSAVLQSEVDAFLKHRTATFSARRSGGAVVSTSAEGDVQALLRFFGWLSHTDSVPGGAFLYMRSMLVFPILGDLVQQYAEWLESNQGLRFSSIANYLNSLASVVTFAYTTFDVPDATLELDPSPLTQILNLRGQAEKASKQQNLFDKRVGGWLDWEDVQKARVTAMEKVAAHTGSAASKQTLLREACAASLLSLIPPDRVGLIRKLRMGHTLKRADGGGWRLDLTSIKDGHKTSRFYGPFAAKLPSALDGVLDAYTSALELAGDGGDEAYLFHPISGANDRPMESSAWTAWVKRLFKKLASVDIAPKTLRAIFITWLRERTDCPEVLKSAAHAMKHRPETQASGSYDKNKDQKLVKAAFEFNLQFAQQFGAPGASSGGASSSGGEGSSAAAGPDMTEWQRVEPQPDAFIFVRAQGNKFACNVPWLEPFAPGMKLWMPTVPGLVHGLRFQIPNDASVVGMQLGVSIEVADGTIQGACFGVGGLLMPKQAADAPPVEAADDLQADETLDHAPFEGDAPADDAQADDTPERGSRPPSVAPTEVADEATGEEAGGEEAGGEEAGGEEAAMAAVGEESEAVATEPRRSGRHAAAPRLSFPMAPVQRTPRAPRHSIEGEAARDVTGIAVGDQLLAKGLAPAGNRAWFMARVLKLRPPPAMPPITVEYVATESGESLALLLPQPRKAYVYKADTKPLP